MQPCGKTHPVVVENVYVFQKGEIIGIKQVKGQKKWLKPLKSG